MHLEWHSVGRQKAILFGFSTVPQENESLPFTSTLNLSHNSHRSYHFMSHNLNQSETCSFIFQRQGFVKEEESVRWDTLYLLQGHK